ncbi:HTH_Tnp_Tc3_2 domain-containing protein [Trichonephila clavipes]|uniref:HTH_Tnp_Tc3_2 domain-containing protein n=1 Tax=Trichonephila clavipes TaxID=2585209 RepID=A0A8X6S4M9_TRICX|nr:HTH_Tnp_Tc3_2 domain-containing protein [Trichonephila clavipes]
MPQQLIDTLILSMGRRSEKVPHRRIGAHYEQLSEFERGRIIGLKEGRIGESRYMGRSDAVIRRCWQKWVDNGRFQCHDGSGGPRATADQEDRLIVRSVVTAFELSLRTLRRWNHSDWGRVVFSDESRFNLCHPDDHRRCVWRRPRQSSECAFTISRHAGPQQEVMVWDVISFEVGPLWSSLDAHLQHIDTSMAF